MGRIATVLSFVRQTLRGAAYGDVKAEQGGGQINTGEHFQTSGSDAQPLPGDRCVMVEVPRSGGYVVVGYIDTKNAGTAGPGEHRMYSRDASGAVKAEIWAKADGSIVITNGAGTFTMAPSGDVDVNGVLITPSGDVTIPGTLDVQDDVTVTGEVTATGEVSAAGIGLTSHRHTGVTPGPGVTGGPIP